MTAGAVVDVIVAVLDGALEVLIGAVGVRGAGAAVWWAVGPGAQATATPHAIANASGALGNTLFTRTGSLG